MSIFIKNKYNKWYFKIIKNAKHRVKSKNTEHHHILPTSLFPKYKNLKQNPWNGVHLTFREHILVHLLLTKMVPNGTIKSNLVCTVLMMGGRDYMKGLINSRLYESVKTLHKETMRSRTGENNSNWRGGHNSEKKCPVCNETWIYHKASTCRSCYDSSGENNSMYGKKHSDYTRRLIKEKRALQENIGTYKRTDEIKEKIRQTLKETSPMIGVSKPIVTCPHCGESGGEPAMKRWHFDKCHLF